MEDSFDKVDDETKTIYENIKNIKLTDRLIDIIEQSGEIASKLKSILFKTKYIKENNEIVK